MGILLNLGQFLSGYLLFLIYFLPAANISNPKVYEIGLEISSTFCIFAYIGSFIAIFVVPNYSKKYFMEYGILVQGLCLFVLCG